MKPSLRLCLGAWSAAWLLAACGGGSDSETAVTPDVERPIALVQADRETVEIGGLVRLDGSASTSPTGGVLSYEWALIAPTNSSAKLSDSRIAQPTFIADQYGRYIADLVVSDGNASSNHTRVAVTVLNTMPIAVTPTAVSGKLGDIVTLDGSQSLAPSNTNASELKYHWTLVAPTGSLATLNASNQASVNFQADIIGKYEATLIVSLGNQRSEPVNVTISVSEQNTIPVAHAGGPYQGVRGQKIQLDGKQSSDLDGDKLMFRWEFLTDTGTRAGKPIGSQATLTDANTATPSFIPDMAGTYNVGLYVYDGISGSERAVAQIVVSKPAGAVNQAPVAVFRDLPSPEGERAARWGQSFFSDSYDVDGDALTYKWKWLSYPEGFTPNEADLQARSNIDYVYAVLPVDGNYTLQLIVNDGQLDSEPVTQTMKVMLGANVKPIARASADLATVMVGSAIWFDGKESSDENGNSLEYFWTLIDRPDGSNANLQQTQGQRVSLIPDVAGGYVVELIVKDNLGAASNIPVTSTVPTRVRVYAKTQNHKPVTRLEAVWQNNLISSVGWGLTGERFSATQPYVINRSDSVSNGGPILISNAYDPDGDALQYLWTLQRPNGSNLPDAMAGTDDTGSSSWEIKPDVAGTYTGTVAVSDNIDLAAPQSINVIAVERANYPSLLLETGGTKAENWNTSWYRQDFFPFLQTLYSFGYYALNDGEAAEQTYRLTAFDRDYTVTDLQVSSKDSGYQPWISGLSNGDIIRKGESVEFRIGRPTVAGEDPWDFENADRIAGYEFSWSFRIAEKEGWTFTIKN